METRVLGIVIISDIAIMQGKPRRRFETLSLLLRVPQLDLDPDMNVKDVRRLARVKEASEKVRTYVKGIFVY